MRWRTPRRRGFFLLAFMIALMILGVFSILAIRLFGASLRVTRQAQEGQTRIARMQGMLELMRRDVWGADRFEATSTRLLIEGASKIEWKVMPDMSVVRLDSAANAQQRAWAELGQGVSFRVNPTTVIVHIEQGPVKHTDDLAMAAQMALVRRGMR